MLRALTIRWALLVMRKIRFTCCLPTRVTVAIALAASGNSSTRAWTKTCLLASLGTLSIGKLPIKLQT